MDIKNEQIVNYVEALLAERGFSEDLPDEIKEQLRQDLYERLNNFFIAKIIEAFPKDRLEELEEKLSKEKDADVWLFIKDNLSDFDALTLDLLVEFRSKYLGV